MSTERQIYGEKPHVLLIREAPDKAERITCTICNVSVTTDLDDWRIRLDFSKKHNGCGQVLAKAPAKP